MAGEILPGQMSEGIDTPAVGRYAVGYLYITALAADTETFTINSAEYEFDTANDAIVGAGVEINDAGDAAPTDNVDSIVVDLNADPAKEVTAVDLGSLVAFVSDDAGTAGNYSLAETMAGANGVVSAANMVGGEARDLIPLERVSYTLTTNDVTALADGNVTGVPIGCIDLGIAAANLGLYGLTVQLATGEFKSPATVGITFVAVSGTKCLIVLTDAGATLALNDVIRMLISAQ
jgi:hypothetical protein